MHYYYMHIQPIKWKDRLSIQQKSVFLTCSSFEELAVVDDQHLTEGGQSKHAVKVPFLGVSDDVGGVAALLWAVEQRPPQVGLTQQAEHTQLPVDLDQWRKTNTNMSWRLRLKTGRRWWTYGYGQGLLTFFFSNKEHRVPSLTILGAQAQNFEGANCKLTCKAE